MATPNPPPPNVMYVTCDVQQSENGFYLLAEAEMVWEEGREDHKILVRVRVEKGDTLGEIALIVQKA